MMVLNEFQAWLPAVTAEAIGAVIATVLDKNALLVTDGGTVYPLCAAALGTSHERLNQSLGERARGEFHIQTVNNRCSRLKDFLRAHRGIPTPPHRPAYDTTPRHCRAVATGT